MDMAIHITNLGKRYNLYSNPKDKLLDAFGLLRFFPRGLKRTQSFWALRGINLSIQRGQRIALVGRNGAGKSTLLKLICRNALPTEGVIQVNGKIQALMEMGTAFHPDFTGRENIQASLAYHGLSIEERLLHEEEIEDFVELGTFLDQPVRTYSAGMYARLAFATSTSIKPDILIVDEILGAGDAYFSIKCAERMKQLTQESGATLLFVSHDLSSIQQMCDRAIWIEQGSIVMDGTPLDVTKTYYAETLRIEEMKITQRNFKKQYKSSMENQSDVLLFCLNRADGQSFHERHLIKNISLVGDGLSFEVRPGSPMDNDCTQTASINPLFDSGWEEPEYFDESYVRYISGKNGIAQQATFQFVYPGIKHNKSLCLLVTHLSTGRERLTVNLYDGTRYVALGELSVESNLLTEKFNVPVTTIFNISDAEGDIAFFENSKPSENTTSNESASIDTYEANSEFCRIKQSSDQFSSNYAEIISIQIGDGKKKKSVFKHGDDIFIHVKLRILQKLPIAVFDMAMYQQGVVIYVGYWPIGENISSGEIEFDICLQSPALRQNEYILSFAVLDRFPLTGADCLFYCEWNRTHSFYFDEQYIGKICFGIIDLQTKPVVGHNLLSL